MDNYVFLLGAPDLEMAEIEKLLQANTCLYKSKISSWSNAFWVTYREDIELAEKENKTIVGIELRDTAGFKKNENWLLIDHHNENSQLPSSIEQLISDYIKKPELLEDRHIQLVAANDKGHIAGMKKINATHEQIETIRRADRKAQGVTNDEEEQAVNDLAKGTLENGLTIIKTNIEHFSAITDRIDNDRLLVYSDSKLCYYGWGANTIIKSHYSDLVAIGKAYFGGTGHGYFGISQNELNPEELGVIKNKIIELSEVKSLK
jgi:hypothetical protein